MKIAANKIAVLCLLSIALFCKRISSIKHHLVLEDDSRRSFSVSSFGYLRGGRLEVIVQNLTIFHDQTRNSGPHAGFTLTKSDKLIDSVVSIENHLRTESCIFNMTERPSYFNHDLIIMVLKANEEKVLVSCSGDNNLPFLKPLPLDLSHFFNGSHGSYKHSYEKRAVSPQINPLDPNKASFDPDYGGSEIRMRTRSIECTKSYNIPLRVEVDARKRVSYAFNFTMMIEREEEEGLYHLDFHNCYAPRPKGSNSLRNRLSSIPFDSYASLDMKIDEFNMPENYLSAGMMPFPQMYFILSVMFLLSGCIWVNHIVRQKDHVMKIHYLMTTLVFAKSCSLLFHGINYHYIALEGQPVVALAYLYYITRSIKGVLFFLTLVLIGSGWSFIKHILSNKDKKVILVIVALQIVAHIAEIILDESTEGQASVELWTKISCLVDLFSCVAILYPISWSLDHLGEASRTDGKAAINLKRLQLFKRFYIISTIYIYVTRIAAISFVSFLSFRSTWLAALEPEVATLIYFIVTGYYFQPMPTNPYLLLPDDNDFEEDILFGIDTHFTDGAQLNHLDDQDQSKNQNNTENQRVTRRFVDDIV